FSGDWSSDVCSSDHTEDRGDRWLVLADLGDPDQCVLELYMGPTRRRVRPPIGWPGALLLATAGRDSGSHRRTSSDGRAAADDPLRPHRPYGAGAPGPEWLRRA